LKGSPKIIEQLNHALREQLTAVNQFFVHAEMCENWGYGWLAKFIKKQSIDEMKHAEPMLETQLRQIAEIGYERYLTTQTSESRLLNRIDGLWSTMSASR
jgi:bacterioferritin (cytochrome b1)